MKKLKVLIVNKFYYHRGGDCIASMALEKLLLAKGHEVAFFGMEHSSNFESLWNEYFVSNVGFDGGIKSKIKAAKRIFGFGEIENKFKKILDDFAPDVVHLNNIHTQLSPRIAQIAKQRNIKVYWTMHDYKLICPSYSCYNRGKICEKCIEGNTIYALKDKCMKGSLVASAMAYLESIYWRKKDLISYTDAFIAPSCFMKKMLIKASFPEDKIVVLPNFINREFSKNESVEKDDYYCYVGRVEDIKGIRTLIAAAKQLPYKLIVIGDGSLKNEFIDSLSNIELVGFKDWNEIEKILSKAKFLVTPSEWYEVFGLGNIESQCLGTPVLGADIGGIPETIEVSSSGMLFRPGDVQDLKEKIDAMYNRVFDYDLIRESARSKFSQDNYYEKIISLYNKR